MKILIVKLGALGDVLRTTPILTGFRKKYPSAEFSWVVDTRHAEVLEANPLIRRLHPFSKKLLPELAKESFDLAINLDKEEEALDAITAANAKKKMGFGRDAQGKLCALDAASDYAVRLGVDDELKFRRNCKTYQEISFEQAGLSFEREEYLFDLDRESLEFTESHLRKLGIGDGPQAAPVIGLNTGSGARFAGKKLPIAAYAGLAVEFRRRFGASVLLLGGQDEIERNAEIQALSRGAAVSAGSHSISRFAGIVKRCDLVISGDTTAMHVAIAVKTPVVAYFASTCAAEIELYGRGEKIVSDIFCAPCYKKICPIDEQCMKDMKIEAFVGAAERCLAGRFSKSGARA